MLQADICDGLVGMPLIPEALTSQMKPPFLDI